MQSWFWRPFGPFIVLLFKCFWHSTEKGPTSNAQRGLDKEFVVKEFKVVPYAVGVENHEPIFEVVALFIAVVL